MNWLLLTDLLGAILIFLGPRWLRTTAKVGAEEAHLFSAGIRIRPALHEVETVSDSYFPNGGYGYRWLGKEHRGFISGGAQIDIRLTGGHDHAVLAETVEAFCSTVVDAEH